MEKNIQKFIDSDLVKKILGKQANVINYLLETGVSRQELKNLKSSDLYNLVVENWNYCDALKIIREIFKTTPKYINGKNSNQAIETLLKEWRELNLGEVAWPFSQGQFDSFVQSLNSQTISRTQKDGIVKESAVRYRRIKEINTIRNDFLETLVFEKNNQILPTLSHRRGVDFFIDGISYDQKVAKSPTNEFKKKFGINWKKEAIDNPNKVAEYLYTYQDEGRFGCSPRLYIVYLDEDIEALDIQSAVNKINLGKPLDINFTYKHKDTGNKTYRTQAYVILFYKN